MEPIDQKALFELLATAGVNAADPALGIGRELAFARPPTRTVIGHVGEGSHYRAKAVSIRPSCDGSWCLIPRYGSAGTLALVETTADIAGVSFAPSEHSILERYLCERSVHPGATSADLYCLGASGHVLVTWDHHTADEGLTVQLRRVADANRLLV